MQRLSALFRRRPRSESTRPSGTPSNTPPGHPSASTNPNSPTLTTRNRNRNRLSVPASRQRTRHPPSSRVLRSRFSSHLGTTTTTTTTTTQRYPWKTIPPNWSDTPVSIFGSCIRHISSNPQYFKIDVPSKFRFRYDKALQLGHTEAYLAFDPLLLRRLKSLVPSPEVPSEEIFWTRYFWCVRCVRNCGETSIEGVRKMLIGLWSVSEDGAKETHIRSEIEELADILSLRVKEVEELIENWIRWRLECESLSTIEEMIRKCPSHRAKDIELKFGECVGLKKQISILMTEMSDPMQCVQITKPSSVQFIEMHRRKGKLDKLIQEDEDERRYQRDESLFSPVLKDAVLDPPSFTTETMRRRVILDLPHRLRRSHWRLLYSTKEHGISLFTLLDRSTKKGPSVLFVQADTGEIFGAFVSRSWRHSRKYFGTGESFVFRWVQILEDPPRQRQQRPLVTQQQQEEESGVEEEQEADQEEEEEGESIPRKKRARRRASARDVPEGDRGWQTMTRYKSFPWNQTNRLFCLSNLDVISVGGGGNGPAIYLDSDLLYGSSNSCETFGSTPLVKGKEFRVIVMEVWGLVRKRKEVRPHLTPEMIEERAADALAESRATGIKPVLLE